MSLTLKPYPEYKESGVPWLSKIPAHWERVRNGRLFSERNQRGYPELPILEVSLKTGVRVRSFTDSNRKQVMANRGQYKRAVKGDISYNMMRTWQGAVGVAPVDGLVSPAYVVAQPFPHTDGRYYAYLFRTAVYMNEVNKYSHGIVTDRNRLYWDEFKQMPSVFPTVGEQRRIADYLDSNARRVQAVIRAKRRIIALLNEQKLAMVAHAVTPPSDRRNGWVSRPLKYWVDINGRSLVENTDPEYKFLYLDIGSVSTGYLIRPPERMRFGSAPSRARRIVCNGDTIISTVRTYLKAIYHVTEDEKDLIVSTGFAVLTPLVGVDAEYLSYVIQAKSFIGASAIQCC